MGQDDTRQDRDRQVISDALSHPVRRDIVEQLRETGGTGLQYLTIEITRREAERRGISKSAIGFDRMQDELVREHIPVLQDTGIVRYKPDTEWLEIDGSAADFIEANCSEE